MTKFLAISQNTFIQAIRQPVFSVLLLVMFLVLVLTLPLTNWAMGNDYRASNQQMFEELGLSTLLMMGLLAAAFSASGALSREIEDKTALTVISKPVSRTTFVLGKFFGVGSAVLLFYYLGALVYLLAVRHKVTPSSADPYDWPVIVLGCSALGISILIAMAGNLVFAWTFTSAAVTTLSISLSISAVLVAFIGKGWQIVPFGQDIDPQLLVALLLLVMAVFVFVAVAIVASTRTGQVVTLLICGAVFFIGSVHPALFGYWNDRTVLSRPLGWVFPDLGYFYAIDALASDKTITMGYVAGAARYCACYVAAMLALGAALFQHRQLESQATSSSMPGLVALLSWAGRIAAGLLALVGLEGMLSVGAAGVSDSFQPVFLSSIKALFFQAASSDALVLIPSAGMIVVAGLAWLLWGCFGRGARWSYWAVLVLTALAWLHALAGELGVLGSDAGPRGQVLLGVRMMLTSVVLAVLCLPKTRHHFKAVVR